MDATATPAGARAGAAWKGVWAVSSIAAVAVGAASDELRSGYDKDAHGALSGDLVAIVVATLAVGAIVFVGLRGWASRRGDGIRPAVVAAVLALFLLPFAWWTAASLVAAAGATMLARGDEANPATAARWTRRLAALAVVAVLVANIAAVIVQRS